MMHSVRVGVEREERGERKRAPYSAKRWRAVGLIGRERGTIGRGRCGDDEKEDDNQVSSCKEDERRDVQIKKNPLAGDVSMIPRLLDSEHFEEPIR